MTGIKVVSCANGHVLKLSGDLDGRLDVFEPVSHRVSFSDGTVTRWDCVNDNWVCTIIIKGSLLEIVSVDAMTNELYFKKGLKWCIAYMNHYDIVVDREQKQRHYHEAAQSLTTIGDTDDGDDAARND